MDFLRYNCVRNNLNLLKNWTGKIHLFFSEYSQWTTNNSEQLLCLFSNNFLDPLEESRSLDCFTIHCFGSHSHHRIYFSECSFAIGFGSNRSKIKTVCHNLPRIDFPLFEYIAILKLVFMGRAESLPERGPNRGRSILFYKIEATGSRGQVTQSPKELILIYSSKPTFITFTRPAISTT